MTANPDTDKLPSPRKEGTDFLRRFLPQKRRTRIAIEASLLIFAIIAATVWFSAPYLARNYINRTFAGLPDYTGRVEWVRFHPLTASADIYQLRVDKKAGQVPIPFFFSPRWNISLQWSQIFHGAARASVVIFNPQVNLVAGPSQDQSQTSISMIWVDTIKQLIPWRVNEVKIQNGDVHFRDFHADPPVDLEASGVQLAAENISNSQQLKVPLPATVKVTARPLNTGTFEMHLAINFDEKYATFTQNFQMQHVPAQGANSALKKYLKVEMKSGEIGLYSELTGDKGVYHGYVKPFFYNLVFMPKPEDQHGPGVIWAGVLNTVKGLFEDDRKVIATEAPISGRIDQPNVDGWGAFLGVLWNAYIEALRPGFDPDHSPPTPTDTVTTPQSPSTQQEAQSLPDKKK